MINLFVCLHFGAFVFPGGSAQAEKKCQKDSNGDTWLETSASSFASRSPGDFGSAIKALDSFLFKIPFLGKLLVMIQRFVVNTIIFLVQNFESFSFASVPNIGQSNLGPASSLSNAGIFDFAAMLKEDEPSYSPGPQDLDFEDETEIGERIIGGQPSRPHEFPHQVALFEQGRFVCGGSILSRWYVLTAAHCIHK